MVAYLIYFNALFNDIYILYMRMTKYLKIECSLKENTLLNKCVNIKMCII